MRHLMVAVLLAGAWVGGVEAQGRYTLRSRPHVPVQADPQPPPTPAYYVRTDGNNANTGLANTVGGAWKTIDWAADHMLPGDTVRVQAGTYAAQVTPAVSGTDGSPLTFVADGAVTFCGITSTSKNYLRFIGFTIDTNAGGCTIANRAVQLSGTSTGWEFWHNTIRDAGTLGIGTGQFADRHHNFVIIGNTFTTIGPSGAATRLRGNYNLSAYNEITNVDPDGFLIDGTYSLWLNNYIHGQPVTAPTHGDGFQSNSSSLGLSYNVVEGNLLIGEAVVPDEHGALIQNQSVTSCSTGTCGAVTENLFRYNVWHNISSFVLDAESGVSNVGAMLNTRQVHDTVVGGMRQIPTSVYSILFRNSSTASLFNNLLYEAWGATATSNIAPFFIDTGASITAADYNLAYDPDGSVTFTTPWTSQAHPLSNINPSLTNVAGDDFTLGSGSSARNAGGALTTASGGGTGTTFNVASGGGGWFRGPNTNITTYGGKLTAGDVITVGTDVVTVVSIAGDAITVTPSFTWADADPVYLGNDTTPDIGALPYKAGGYTLSATYATVGGTATITPNDASLVRFVVCYVEGIPTTVDESSPYTCAVSGTPVIRVYPRFASATLWATATP